MPIEIFRDPMNNNNDSSQSPSSDTEFASASTTQQDGGMSRQQSDDDGTSSQTATIIGIGVITEPKRDWRDVFWLGIFTIHLIGLGFLLSVLELNRFQNRSCGPDKSTALHCAASGGSVNSVEVVKLVLVSGADPNSLDSDGCRLADVIVVSSNGPTEDVAEMVHTCF